MSGVAAHRLAANHAVSDRLHDSVTAIPWSIVLVCAIALVASIVAVSRASERRRAPLRLEQAIAEQLALLKAFIEENFLLEPCQRCLESQWHVLESSPTGRSIHAMCTTCGKDRWMGCAGEPDAELAPELAELVDLRAQHEELYAERGAQPKLSVMAPTAPLPTDGVTREPIPEPVRAQVWRRDAGRCCRCEATAQLEFDHVIPVARGGSSTVNNVQLLCRGCNRSKGARM